MCSPAVLKCFKRIYTFRLSVSFSFLFSTFYCCVCKCTTATWARYLSKNSRYAAVWHCVRDGLLNNLHSTLVFFRALLFIDILSMRSKRKHEKRLESRSQWVLFMIIFDSKMTMNFNYFELERERERIGLNERINGWTCTHGVRWALTHALDHHTDHRWKCILKPYHRLFFSLLLRSYNWWI